MDWSALGVARGFIVIVECEWFECCEGKRKRERVALIEEREYESSATNKVFNS